ncbi:ParA family protein [Krasilnikovia sp. MM14-A1259]|uniref:ParA family protein n=1 Tax=Krasilnikovia sp. MM14-A1259 TaxID=3373539 RepID=UPI00381B5528
MAKSAFMNQSGGAGKTTSITGVAVTLATKKHRRARVWDCDTNRDSSQYLGYDNPDDIPDLANVVDVLHGDAKAKEATAPARIPTPDDAWRPIPNLELVPGSVHLASFDVTFANKMKREERLAIAFEEDDDARDHELVDGPASLGLLAMNILMGVDFVNACVKPGMKEIRALAELEGTIADINQWRKNNPVQLGAIIVADRPPRNAGIAYEDAIKVLVNEYGRERIVPLVDIETDAGTDQQYGVSRTVRVAEAYQRKIPLPLYAPTTRASTDTEVLTDQLLKLGVI